MKAKNIFIEKGVKYFHYKNYKIFSFGKLSNIFILRVTIFLLKKKWNIPIKKLWNISIEKLWNISIEKLWNISIEKVKKISIQKMTIREEKSWNRGPERKKLKQWSQNQS